MSSFRTIRGLRDLISELGGLPPRHRQQAAHGQAAGRQGRRVRPAGGHPPTERWLAGLG